MPFREDTPVEIFHQFVPLALRSIRVFDAGDELQPIGLKSRVFENPHVRDSSHSEPGQWLAAIQSFGTGIRSLVRRQDSIVGRSALN